MQIDGSVVYVSDVGNSCIRKVDANGQVSTFAGSVPGYQDGPGHLARFEELGGIAVNSDGFVFVADTVNNVIRKISPDGVAGTLAGNGGPGYEDGFGAEARFYGPESVAIDNDGNVIVADSGNNCIRKVTPAGQVTTIAGQGTDAWQDGMGASAKFHNPSDVAVDPAGNIIVADMFNHCIRKITPEGFVSTLAGSGVRGCQNGRGVNARFNEPQGVTIDQEGDVIVCDVGNNSLRKVTAQGDVTILAGGNDTMWNGRWHTLGFINGSPDVAMFNEPAGVALDGSGNLIVADSQNNVVRKVQPDGYVTTFAGRGINGGFFNGSALQSKFRQPCSVAISYGRPAQLSVPSSKRPAQLSGPSSKKRRLCEDFGKLLNDLATTDVSFLVEGERIRAHQLILTARSQYFGTMFASAFQEGTYKEVEVKDATANAFRAMLRFFYSADVELDSDNVAHVMLLAHRYDIADLFETCKDYCVKHLSVQNCIDWLMLWRRYKMTIVEDIGLDFAAKCLQDGTLQISASRSLDMLLKDEALMREVLLRFRHDLKTYIDK